MNLAPPRRLLLAAAAALLALPALARADFATTNLQVLEGWYFYDPTVAEDVKGGQMNTITLNHFDTWKYGDNFAFVDLMQGDFRDGTKSHLYAEIHPRLFLNRILGTKGNVLGIFRDAGVASEFNVGHGFQAWLVGLGADFALPIPGTVTLNVYYKYAELQLPSIPLNTYHHGWQVSPSWVVPFAVGKLPFLLTGFVDINDVAKTDGTTGLEVMAQPELLVDLLGPMGGPKDKILVGVEWYLHYNSGNKDAGAPHNLISSPQAMIQWNLH